MFLASFLALEVVEMGRRFEMGWKRGEIVWCLGIERDGSAFVRDIGVAGFGCR